MNYPGRVIALLGFFTLVTFPLVPQKTGQVVFQGSDRLSPTRFCLDCDELNLDEQRFRGIDEENPPPQDPVQRAWHEAATVMAFGMYLDDYSWIPALALLAKYDDRWMILTEDGTKGGEQWLSGTTAKAQE